MSRSGATAMAVVVTGVPASGKSTLARALAERLPARLMSFDTIKEQLFDASDGALEGVDLRMASEARLAAELRTAVGLAVIDIWIQPTRDTERVAALLTANSSRVFEILCRVPVELAIDRYRERSRSGPHNPADDETLQRIRDASAGMTPLYLGPCVEVDTSRLVDTEALVALVSDWTRRKPA